MKKHGILNSSISKVLADLGHTDQITIGDCGLPIPASVEKIDLALALGSPSFDQVFELVLEDMKVEKVFLAAEIKEKNPDMLTKIQSLLAKEDQVIEIVWISHEQFKQQSHQSRAIIRTGEASPYANIILQSAVVF